jgi:hypothetical protein
MRGFSFLRYRIKKESRETIWMCREKIQRHLIPNLSHLIHVANGWGREGNNTVVFSLERWKNKRDGAHLSLYMCYIGLHIASVAQQELTDNCVASIQHLRFPTFLPFLISYPSTSVKRIARRNTLESVELFLSPWWIQCCVMQYVPGRSGCVVYRFGTSRGNLLISFVKFSSFFFFFFFFHLFVFLFSILPCLFDLLFRKLKEKDCLAPSWCWVMTAHSFVVVASPYTSAVQVYMADGHQLFFSRPLSICPLLSSQHIFYLTYSLASVRKTIENILGNCAQREHRPHHQRALWCSSVVLFLYIQKGEIQRTSHKTTNIRGVISFIWIFLTLFIKL